MKHLSQDDLILHYYGEGSDGITKHIAKCSECRANFDQLSWTLSAIALPEPPVRGEGYSAEVWSRIRPKLKARTAPTSWLALPRRWAVVASVAVLIAIAFLVGRYTNRPSAKFSVEATDDAQLPQKVLGIALADYYDRSEMLLLEVAHANRPEDLDLNTQRRYASELVATNRLYRQTAQRVGDAETSALLDHLDRVLLQVAHTPQGATAADIQQLRQQIDSGALLFKVRVAQVQIKAQAESGNRARTAEDPATLQDHNPIL
jgi:hypothetical protein